jgi:hypothetical protein
MNKSDVGLNNFNSMHLGSNSNYYNPLSANGRILNNSGYSRPSTFVSNGGIRTSIENENGKNIQRSIYW